ncbi:hypothetical protein FOA52_012139 [Chlamydomonas sp. UWO 241]|nr:hypothetical protein FOA52_012139 [Chlamydomonas sp. UWO 241]
MGAAALHLLLLFAAALAASGVAGSGALIDVLPDLRSSNSALAEVSGPGGKLCDDAPLYALNVSVGNATYPALTDFLQANALLLQGLTPANRLVNERGRVSLSAAPHLTLFGYTTSSPLMARLLVSAPHPACTLAKAVEQFRDAHRMRGEGISLVAATKRRADPPAAGTPTAQPVSPKFSIMTDLLDARAFPASFYPNGLIVKVATLKRGMMYAAEDRLPGDRAYNFRSCSKAVIAAVMLALQDAGLLKLDDFIASHLPSWADAAARNQTHVGAITIRHILTHTSGIALASGLAPISPFEAAVIGNSSISLADAAAALIAMPKGILLAPGTRFKYTAAGFQVLGAVAEKVTGVPWREVLSKYLTGPLGMRRTAMYNMWGEPDPRAGNPTLAYGLISTADDMWAFVTMLAANGSFTPPGGGPPVRVLSEAAVRDMATPQLGPHIQDADTMRAYWGRYIPWFKEWVDWKSGGLAWESYQWGEANFINFTYGLGMWLFTDTSGNFTHGALWGAYNNALNIYRWNTDDPGMSLGMSFATFNDLEAADISHGHDNH